MTPNELLTAIAAILERGFELIVDEISPAAEQAFRERGLEIVQQLKLKPAVADVVDRAAVEYAKARAGELIKNFAETTPEMLRATIADAIENGWSTGKLRDMLRENYAFSPARALTIARTETAIARRHGGLESARAGGAEAKHWWVADDDACQLCLNNQAAGWIPIDEDFPEGDDPHPNCVCPGADYRMKSDSDEPASEAA